MIRTKVIKIKNRDNRTPMVKDLGIVTMREFNLEYNTMARSSDMLPKASSIFPLTDSDGCSSRRREKGTDVGEPIFSACIFYDLQEGDGTPKAEEKKPIKMFT